jgi:predicted NAD-dependent protein-ADP-ribosyltransferase YbiA (DUF1768 family)
MVASKINHSIVYHEKRSVENIDIGKLVSLYELEVENRLITKQSLVVSIGSPNKKYLDRGIIFFPIYLITNKKKAIQIGVFEIVSKELYQVIDKSKEADIYEIENYDLLDSPLIWNWVDNLFLKKQKLSPLVLEEEEEEKKQSTLYIEEEEVNQLFEESREKAEELRRENDKNWVSQFMKNEQYDIEDSPDTSDSLFTTIKNAFSKINIILHENKIREKYANSKFVEKDFFYKKRIYDENKTRLVELMNSEKDLKKEKVRIEEEYKKNRTLQLKEEHTSVKGQLKLVRRDIDEINESIKETDFENINTIDKYRDYIKSKRFSGDEYSLMYLENIMNIKFIVFLKDANDENDIKSIVDCGKKNPELMDDFIPEHYILLEYREKTNRYNLIGYGGKFIFQFRELPYDLKEIISNKCVEGIEGNFINIPDFKNFHVNVKSRELPTIHPQMGITIESIQRLNDGVRLFIYCSSSSSKTPGKIAGEVMPENQKHKYIELKGIPNWRCILDNSYDGTDLDSEENKKPYQFELNGFYWMSVEHYINAIKFIDEHPKYYESFALAAVGEERDIVTASDLAKDVQLAQFIGNKPAGTLFKGKENGDLKGYYRKTSIQIDTTYNEEKASTALYNALFSKFTQNPSFKKVLLATNDSLLVNAPPRKKQYDAEELMKVRDEIKIQTNYKK